MNTHFLEKGFTCLCLPSGVRTIAPNGFMNGTAEEDGVTDDSYPDGPLQSGTMSLRRVKPKSKVSSRETLAEMQTVSKLLGSCGTMLHAGVAVFGKVAAKTATSL